MDVRELEAADGLQLRWTESGARVAWGADTDGAEDWLGPIGASFRGTPVGPPKATTPFEGADGLGAFHGLRVAYAGVPDAIELTVRAYAELPLLVFRAEAHAELDELATGTFDRPVLGWPHCDPTRRSHELPAGSNAYGHAYTEFALPTFSDPSLASFMLLGDRPAVVQPLVLRTEGRALLLAPLDAFHDQVIAVPRGGAEASRGVHCGWHGDLERVEAGFASELAVWGGQGVRERLEAWGRHLQRTHRTRRRSRYADPTIARLSYWTDNGAAYWYRTEPGLDVEETLSRVMEGLRRDDVPVHVVELDSWFYPHATTRPLNAPEVDVPPTGLVTWEPRSDALPEGVLGLRARLGNPPLILHLRHFSNASPYFQRTEVWRDAEQAHPIDPQFYDKLFAQAEGWGAIQVEHDWLSACYLGVRGLRAVPGRAEAWQRGVDAAAAGRGLSLLWCMATPADFCESVTLDRITAIRTSGDYRYFLGNASLWCWFLYGNALARALGLWPFKDVFLSSREGEGLDGDPHAELEALLATLSAGPVGIGDRVDRTDRALVLRTCREDGVLVKPDVPLAPLERCFRQHAHLAPTPLVGETHSDHPAGRFFYLVAIHASREAEAQRFDVALDELSGLDPETPRVAYDWREGTVQRVSPESRLAFHLEPADWSFHVLAPLLPGGIAILGDPERYASVGDRRIFGVRRTDSGASLDVLGAPGEIVTLAVWSEGPIDVTLRGEADPTAAITHPRESGGVHRIEIPIGPRGRTSVSLQSRQ